MSVLENIFYFVELTLDPQVLWNIAPLAIATILMLVYQEIYKKERPGWKDFLTASLVLLFVSMSLFRYLYSMNNGGAINFVEYPEKTIASGILLLLGLLLLRFNFEHVLPEKFAGYISSPLIINLFAYSVILYVHSQIEITWKVYISLLFLVLMILGILFLIKYPIKEVHKKIQKEKRKERIKNAKEAVFQIKELKCQLREREKELKKIRLREVESDKKQGSLIKKILKKGKGRKRR